MTTSISSSARWEPTQWRLPPPNGIQPSLLVSRSGSKPARRPLHERDRRRDDPALRDRELAELHRPGEPARRVDDHRPRPQHLADGGLQVGVVVAVADLVARAARGRPGGARGVRTPRLATSRWSRGRPGAGCAARRGWRRRSARRRGSSPTARRSGRPCPPPPVVAPDLLGEHLVGLGLLAQEPPSGPGMHGARGRVSAKSKNLGGTTSIIGDLAAAISPPSGGAAGRSARRSRSRRRGGGSPRA